MTAFGPPDTFGCVIFCDDIRREMDGKFTLVGCYGADMVFAAPFPVVLPKLGISVQFFEVPDGRQDDARLEVYFPGDPPGAPGVVSDLPVIEAPASRVDATQADGDSRRLISANIILSPVNIQKAGDLRVQITKGGNTFRIGRIRVSQGNFPK